MTVTLMMMVMAMTMTTMMMTTAMMTTMTMMMTTTMKVTMTARTVRMMEMILIDDEYNSSNDDNDKTMHNGIINLQHECFHLRVFSLAWSRESLLSTSSPIIPARS